MRRLVVLLGLLHLGLGAAAQTTSTVPETALEKGKLAEKAENFQQAIEDYQQARRDNPTSAEPSRALAQLYASQGLHRLALPAWEDVLAKAPDAKDSWTQVAQTHGLLNEDTLAIDVYKRALVRFPDDLDFGQALAWVLFKTEQFAVGIRLLEDMVRRVGTNSSVEMVLGTLEASLYNEASSRIHYLSSIEMTKGATAYDRMFRSIAWYNLSLLDKGFYHFDQSADDLTRSIKEQARSTSLLALGELYQGQLNEKVAREHFMRALQTDDTPLTHFDLAKLDQQFGHLAQARSEAQKVATHQDESWIFNFGLTREKFLRDQEELWADIHRSAWYELDVQPRSNLWDWILWTGQKVWEGLQWYFHDQSWKALLVKTSEASLQASNSPEAWLNLTLANRDHPPVALKYLRLSRDHEVPRNPLAAPSYLVEEALLEADPLQLQRALKQLQSPAENSERARVLARLSQLLRGRGEVAAAREAQTLLYQLSPAVLVPEGVSLPVRVRWFGSSSAGFPSWKEALDAYAGQASWDAGEQDRPGVSWDLDLQVADASGAQIRWTLRDRDGVSRRSGNLGGAQAKKMEAIASIFRTIHSSE